MDVLEMHKSKARNSCWKGSVTKSYAKQWNNDMCCMSCLGTERPSVVPMLQGAFGLQDDKQQSAQSNVLPAGACSLGSHLLFLPASGAQQRLLHTASHTYAKYCWTPRSRKENSVETDRGKHWDVPYLTNNHFHDLQCNTWLSAHSSTELNDESCNRLLQVTAEGPHHLWSNVRATSSSSAAVCASGIETGL